MRDAEEQLQTTESNFLSQLENEKTRFETMLQEKDNEIKQYMQRIELLNANAEAEKRASLELERKANSLHDELKSRDDEVGELRLRTRKLEGSVAEYKDQLARKDDELGRFSEKFEKLWQQMENSIKSQQLLAEVQEKSLEKDRQILHLQQVSHSKDGEIAQLSERVTQLQTELDKAHATVNRDVVADAEMKILQGKLSVRDQQIEVLNAKLADIRTKFEQQIDLGKSMDSDALSIKGSLLILLFYFNVIHTAQDEEFSDRVYFFLFIPSSHFLIKSL